MYPYLRLLRIVIQARLGSPLTVDEESVIKTRVFFGDIDFYPELNNGRHLTLMDLGRFDLAARTGILKSVHKQKWGFAIAGASVRYRHRIKFFWRFRLHTRLVAVDERWFYFHQRTIRKGKIHSSALIRAGVTSKHGIVPVKEVLGAMGISDWKPGMPKWVQAWADAEELRPWENQSLQDKDQ